METDPALAIVLEALKAALAVPGRRVRFVQLLMEDGTSQLITLPAPSMPQAGSASPTDSVVPGLSDREKAALRALEKADHPLKGRAIAARAGLRYTSHFREMMSGLVQAGLVKLTRSRCYWLASRPLAEGDD